MTRQVVPATPFAQRLVEAQGAKGLTTEALAGQLDISHRVLQKWRSGEVAPNGRNLVALSRVLDKDPRWFYPTPEEAA